MRALWLPDLAIQNDYVLKDENFHHLVNVVRIEATEELLLLNGKGLFVLTEVQTIQKRELRLVFKKDFRKERTYDFDLALGMPKRDALELSLKEATELGFRTIYLIRSEYSQMKFPEEDRLQKLLVSALEQSNAPFLPEVIMTDWKEVPWTSYKETLLLDSQTDVAHKDTSFGPGARLLVVGPEGGFSPAELEFLHSRPKARVLTLPTPILRTPTAVATGAGIMLQSLRNEL